MLSCMQAGIFRVDKYCTDKRDANKQNTEALHTTGQFLNSLANACMDVWKFCVTDFTYFQAALQMYSVVLGLEVLGNPVGLFKGLKDGTVGLFYHPIQVHIQLIPTIDRLSCCN